MNCVIEAQCRHEYIMALGMDWQCQTKHARQYLTRLRLMAEKEKNVIVFEIKFSRTDGVSQMLSYISNISLCIVYLVYIMWCKQIGNTVSYKLYSTTASVIITYLA